MSTLLLCHTLPSGCTLQVRLGDLTTEHVDAIVNAANTYLSHGGGVAGAILNRGGEIIQTESDAWVQAHGPVPTGQVAWTKAGRLPCRWVIHAVGPIWQGGSQNEESLLRSAVQNSLALAVQLGASSIAMPAISSGIFGFPKDKCAEIMIDSAWRFASTLPAGIAEIRFTNIDNQTVEIFRKALSLKIQYNNK